VVDAAALQVTSPDPVMLVASLVFEAVTIPVAVGAWAVVTRVMCRCRDSCRAGCVKQRRLTLSVLFCLGWNLPKPRGKARASDKSRGGATLLQV
jgi:hypothetical protein